MKFSIRDLLYCTTIAALILGSYRHECMFKLVQQKFGVQDATTHQLNENQRIMDSWMRNWKINR